MAPIRDVDHGYRKFFQRALMGRPMVVTVGVQGEQAEEDHDGISNVRLAGVHEFGAEIETRFGTVKIPERSFIRATVDANDGYKDLIRKLATRVASMKIGLPEALGILGEKVVSDMRTRIERGIPPPNAASTIARKGSSKPLIDTGQLKNSITYVVKKDES